MPFRGRNGGVPLQGGFRELRESAVCGRAVDDWGRDGMEFCEEAEY